MFILTLRNHDSGVFSIVDDLGEHVIPIWHEYDDVERYNIMISDLTDDKIPLDITEVDEEVICTACEDRDQKYAIISPDDLLIPPEDILA
tara:strand:+ start:1141 stop:1410 length:270 start_codon:yes stop_codon:yes gene_type:complete